MIEEKENALRIILTKYEFKDIEIDKICKDLKGKDINIGNAESILEKLKDLGVIRSTGVIKKIAKILQKCRLNNLNDISNVLSDPKNNHLFKDEEEKEGAIKEILGKAGSILFNADKEKLQGVIDALKGANLNPTTVMVRCSDLFKQTNGEKIEKLVEILKRFDLSPKLIEQCTSLLTHNSNEEIEKIIIALQENFPKDSNYTYIDIINSCPTILAYGKANQITDINNKLKDLFDTFDSTKPSKYSSLYEQLIHECPSIFTQTADEIENIDNILRNLFINLEDEEGDFPSLYDKFIYESPSIFVDGKSHKLENTNNTLKELFAEIPDKKYGNLYNKIIRQKPGVITENNQKIIKIFNILNDEKYYIQNPDKDIKNSYSIISNCPSIFTTTTEKIEDMGITLKSIFKDNNKLYSKILSECGSIISVGDPIEISKINDILISLFRNINTNGYNSLYDKIINECPTIFAQGSTDEINRIKNVLGKDFITFVDKCPSILAEGKADEINKIKNVLGKDFITFVDKCPTILAQGNADNIKSVNDTLSQLFSNIDVNIKVKGKEYNSLYDKIINECPYVFARGSADEINKIKNVLGKDFIAFVDNCPGILTGNADNIKGVNDTLSQLFSNIEVKGKEYNSLYDKIINKCPTILAQGNADNIKSVNDTLSQLFGNIEVKGKEYNSLYEKIINECPYVFARGSADEINKIKDVLGKDFIILIDKCPTILAHGKADAIQNIKDVLGEYYIPLVSKCPNILAQGDSKTIQEVKDQLGENFFRLAYKNPTKVLKLKTQEDFDMDIDQIEQNDDGQDIN